MRNTVVLLTGLFMLTGAFSDAFATPVVEAGEDSEERRGGILPTFWSVDFTTETTGVLDADLEDGGSVESWSREFRIEVSGPGAWIGSSLAFGLRYEDVKYDFDGATRFFGDSHDPFDHARFLSLDTRIFQGLSQEWGVLAIGRIAWNTESGAELSDGRTGFYALGAGYRVNDDLTIGAGIAIIDNFDVNDRDRTVIPMVQLDWQITEKWSLAIIGPGVKLGYEIDDRTTASLGAEIDLGRWRLDESGPSDGEIAIDYRLPLSLSVEHRLEGIGVIEARIGLDLFRELIIDNGPDEIELDVDMGPFFGLSFTLEL